MRIKKYKSSVLSMAVVSALGVTDFAQAQVLEEVVVTARKRSENLQEVPMAVSSFSAAQLRAAQVDGILDLERMTPNVTLTETGGLVAGAIQVFIRGIGNDAGFDQGVGIYADDVYLNRTTGALLEVFDIERIEILKGPQGNLYGRNTIGGAIRFISKEPTEELSGRVEVSAGDYDMMRIRGNVSGPIIGDTLLGNFGALYKTRDGIQTNTFNDGDYWSEDVQAYRGSLVWRATDALKVKLAADYSKDKSDPSIPNRVAVDAGALEGIDFVIGGANTYLGPGTGLTNIPNDASMPTDIDTVSSEFVEGFAQYEIEATTVAMTVEWALNDQWNLKSITANRSMDNTQPYDFDNTDQQFITTINNRTSDDFSQEFQANFDSDNINAVMGLYYLDGTQKSPQFTNQYERLRAVQFQTKDTTKAQNDIESKSAYATVDWNITEEWQLSIGGRYTEDTKKQTQRATVTENLFAFAGLTGFPQDAVVSVAPGQEANAMQSPLFAYWASEFAPPGFNSEFTTLTYPENTDADESWSEFSPSARITWFINDDLMAYTAYQQGFKSGGFQNSGGLTTVYDPETVDAYSIGLKSTWLDGALRLNTEAFYNDYKDKQLSTIVLNGASLDQSVGNVGEVETTGAEVELMWLPPVDGLMVGINVGYLDTEIKSYESGGENIADKTALGFSPDWTAQGRVSYAFDVSDWGSLTASTDVSYRDSAYTNSPIDTTDALGESQYQDAYVIWNAILSFRTQDDRWDVSLEGKNLDDKRVLTNTYVVGPFVGGGYNMPRTWAASVAYNFF